MHVGTMFSNWWEEKNILQCLLLQLLKLKIKELLHKIDPINVQNYNTTLSVFYFSE